MGEIAELTKKILAFRDARDWAQFHTGKDLAICMNVESSELLELFLWKKSEEVDTNKLKEELADVFYSALLLAHQYNLDVNDIVMDKLKRNEEKYPVDKSKGSNKKYDQL